MAQLAEWVSVLSPVRLLNRNNGILSPRSTEVVTHVSETMLDRSLALATSGFH
jgi:hypothetical protein